MARLEGLEPPTYRFEVGYYRRMNNLDALTRRYTMGYAVPNYAGQNKLSAPAYRTVPGRTGHRGWSPAFRREHPRYRSIGAIARLEQVLHDVAVPTDCHENLQ